MIGQVLGVDLVTFSIHGDGRGSLIAIEAKKDLNFDIKRVYYIFDTKEGVVRGKHAHRNINQILICVNGTCDIELFDGKNETTVRLSDPAQGIFIEGYIWREMKNFSKGCVLLVLTDTEYAATEYIYDKNSLREQDHENLG